jgi:hypothetical protein
MQKKEPESPGPDGRPRDADTHSVTQAWGVGKAPDVADQGAARLPHERDESATATGDRTKEDPTPSKRQITKAGEDVAAGRVDTDRRGVPDDVPKGS